MIKANNITYHLIKPHLTYVNYFLKLNGIKIPCVSLDYEIEINKEIGNFNAFKDACYLDDF